jgi:hypothetical protein
VLRCTGSPTGYLRTRQAYKDFRVSFQWRYPENVNGNSGVLVHTTGPDKIWPRSIQVQLHAPKAGSVTGCLPNSGHLALQSQGSEVHFRNIRVDRRKQATATRPE